MTRGAEGHVRHQGRPQALPHPPPAQRFELVFSEASRGLDATLRSRRSPPTARRSPTRVPFNTGQSQTVEVRLGPPGDARPRLQPAPPTPADRHRLRRRLVPAVRRREEVRSAERLQHPLAVCKACARAPSWRGCRSARCRCNAPTWRRYRPATGGCWRWAAIRNGRRAAPRRGLLRSLHRQLDGGGVAEEAAQRSERRAAAGRRHRRRRRLRRRHRHRHQQRRVLRPRRQDVDARDAHHEPGAQRRRHGRVGRGPPDHRRRADQHSEPRLARLRRPLPAPASSTSQWVARHGDEPRPRAARRGRARHDVFVLGGNSTTDSNAWEAS